MSEQQQIESLDLAPNEVQVHLSGNLYVVKEASADVGKRFRNMMMKACRIENNQLAGIGDGLGDVEPALVAGCLFKRAIANDGKTTDSRVTLAEILGWPDRIQKRLAAIAKSISDLDEKKPADEKPAEGEDPNEPASDGELNSPSLASSGSTSTN